MEDNIKTYIGLSKLWVDTKVIIQVFFFITGLLFKGEIPIAKYIRVLIRLIFFLSMLRHNKYVRIGRDIKMNLYVPSFPSRAFFVACKKMLVFDEKMPCLTVLISVTSACRCSCSHCYQKLDKGKDVDIESLVQVVENLQDKGVAFFNIEGGEPFLVYNRLLTLCKAIDHRSEIMINTTGDGVTLQRLQVLKSLGNVTALMFSLHSHTPEGMNAFTANPQAWQNMTRAINYAHAAGIGVTFNSCLQREAFSDGTFENIMDLAKGFNASLIQLIKPKPAGGWLTGGANVFSELDVSCLREKVNSYNLKQKYRNYPFVYSQLLEEEVDMFGCTAGGTDRFYVNAKGDVQPCEFLNISFGNILVDDFDEIYGKMRSVFETPGDCKLCEQKAKHILDVFRSEKIDSLPLNKELSQQIYNDWEKGELPHFYKIVSKL